MRFLGWFGDTPIEVGRADLVEWSPCPRTRKSAKSASRRQGQPCEVPVKAQDRAVDGAPIHAASADKPAFHGLRPGCVDERAQLPPRRQVWMHSAMPWLQGMADVPGTAGQ